MRTFSYNLSVITLLALFVAVLLLSSPSTLLAQPNPQMNYQGKLTNASGVAVPDGQYNMKFWLLASSTAATSTSLWAESRLTTNRVTVVNGLFSVMLGEVTALGSVDFNQSLYLGVEIGGISTSTPVWDGEMSPRKILGTVPAAFEAENAQTLGGIATSSFLRSDEADTMEATSTSALLSLIQNGTGKILSLFRGVTEIFTVLNNGNVGIGTTTPTDKLQVAGNITPSLTDSYSLGSSTLRFLNLFSQNIYASSSILTYATSTAFTTTNFFGTSATTTNLAVTGTATTTFGGGIQLLSGCFRDASATSTCIGKGQAATYVVAASNSKNKQYADYLADGTGDQVEINAAIQAAYTTSRGAGGKVYLLEGDYSVSGTTTMATSTMLVGSGPGTILKVPNANNGNFPIIYFTGSAARSISGITVSDLTIDGNEDNQSSGERTGVYGVYAASSTVKNLAIQNTSGTGISFDYPRSIRISDNNLNRTGLGIYNDAIQVYSDSSFASYDNVIEGNIINYGAYSGAGISIYGVSRTAVSHNTITGDGTTMDTGIGVYQTSSNSPYGNSITGNVISNVQNNGIFLYDAGTGSNPILTTSITGNTITSIGGRGIHLSTAQQSVVTGNVIDDAGQEGILLNYSSNNNTITGNTIWDANGGIVLANTSNRNVISSNKITDSSGSSYAIDISSGNSDNTLVGNYYSGTGAASIYDAGTNTKYTQWDRLTLDTKPLGQVGYSLLSIYASSSVALASTTQLGTGKILSLNNSVGEMFTVSNGGNVGIGSSTPGSKLTVVGGDTYIGGAIQLTSALKDSANATGTLGQILWSTGTSTRWVATSSLGITGGSGSGWALTGDSGTNPNTNFIGTTDAQSLSFRVNNTIWGSLQNTSKSVFFGENSGRSNASTTSNLYNVGIGYQTFGTTTGSNSASGLVAIGTSALFNNTTGVENVAIGYNALTANVTGGYNTAVGYNALSSNTNNYNSAFGSAALLSNTTGYANSAFGTNAMRQNINGYENTAFGDSALRTNTSGVRNVALGHSALYNSTDSSFNVAGGYRALYSNTTGDGNIAFGVEAFGTTTVNNTGSYNLALGSGTLFDNMTGDYNVALGDSALRRNTTGYNNVALGQYALLSNTTGNRNIAVGLDALNANTTGYSNIAIGQDALGDNTNAYGNLAIGAGALSVNTTGTANVALGQSALTSNISGGGLTAAGFTALYRNIADSNSAFGYQAGYSITSGAYNTAIGRNTFGSTTANSTGNNNVAIGESALFDNTSGADNIAIGVNALDSNNTGGSNIAIGRNSLTRNSADYNTAVGDNAGYSITSGFYNTALGRNTFGSTTALMTGTRNVAVGEGALYDNTTGAYNVGIGAYALSSNTTGEYNTAVGYEALATNSTGESNTAIGGSSLYRTVAGNNSAFGDNAGYSITSGVYNTAIGRNTFGSTTALSTGDYNVAVGEGGLYNNTSGSSNVGVGINALGSNTSGQANVAIGIEALNRSNSDYNTAVGQRAGYSITSGGYNVAIGRDTFGTTTANNTGSHNVAIGISALFDNTTGYYNVAVGSEVLQNNESGIGNTGVGTFALSNNVDGSANSAFGDSSLGNNVGGYSNSAFGSVSMENNTDGYQNSAFGTNALRSNTTGDGNIAFGFNTFGTTTVNNTGNNNVAIGNLSLFDNTTGASNVAIGTQALNKNTEGNNNVGIGVGALADNTTGENYTAVGYNALANVNNGSGFGSSAFGSNALTNTVTGTFNSAFGYVALEENLGGGQNSAFGSASLRFNTTGNKNSAFGYDSIVNNTTGSDNSAFGYNALDSNTVGNENSAFGNSALQSLTATSSNNTALGHLAGGAQTRGSNNLFLGYNTSVASTTGSNQLSIGNLIYGTGLGTSDGFVGIGTSSPRAILDVVGAIGFESAMVIQNTASNGASGITLYDNDNGYQGGFGYGNFGHAYSEQLAIVANQADISFILQDTGYSAGAAAMTISNPSGNVGIGTTTPEGRLSIANTSFSTAGGVAGIDQYFSLTNSTNAAVQYGNRSYIYATNTATTTIVGSMYRLADSTTFGNTVRGLEVQVDKGNNTRGENTALSGFARTFGVRGTTIGDAGGTYEPAGVYGETQGSSQGNAIRGYSSTITSAALLKLFQDTSAFTGTGLLMNFGNSGGSYSSTTASKFIDLQNAGTSMFTVGAYGKLTIGDGTTSNNAGIQVGYGGLCVDNDGSCNASTTGRISAVSYHTGNSDLAEVYFSDENLKSGEVVYLKGGLSVGRASEDNKEKVIGVVTTKPGLLLGFDDTSLEAGEEGYGVALAGRVPVRLSNENGEIKTGDELMLSSIAGVVMKASSTGKVVGVALEDFEENRAYSDTYINQFGDDLVDPIVTPISASNDPRMNDGCYYGAGNASGEAPCVPLVATTTDAQVAEAQALAEAEAQAEALAALANVGSKRVTLENGEEVKVGQIVMFVDLKERYLDKAGKEMVAALLASPESSSVIDGVSETVWTRLVTLANNFVDGVLSVFTIKADRVEVKDELCVDGVCLNAEDLRQLLDNAGTGVEEEPTPEEPPAEEEGGGEEEPSAEGTEEGSESDEPVGDGSEEGEEIGGEQTGNEEEGSGEEETAPSEGGEEEPPVEENPTPEEPAPEPEPTPEPAL